jgi:hypothetical protein
MRLFLYFALAGMLVPGSAAAQTAVADNAGAGVSTPPDYTNTPAETSPAVPPEYEPMSFSERAREYIVGAFGPWAVVRAGALGGIEQLTETPGEWKEGAGAYGDRVGSVFAQNVIREALEFGGSAALRQDNRYFRSTDTGFFKRSGHAIASAFVARTEGGREQLAYSRLGAVLGAAFISRLWQPPSADGSGDAAISFGVNMAAGIGWNFVQEFRPRFLAGRLHIH